MRPKFAAADLFPRACILENVTFELSHENQKKEAQIRRRWFISTRMYIGKCDFLVVARKSEKKAQIRRRWFISTRMYREEIF
jgi:hypothetical protein